MKEVTIDNLEDIVVTPDAVHLSGVQELLVWTMLNRFKWNSNKLNPEVFERMFQLNAGYNLSEEKLADVLIALGHEIKVNLAEDSLKDQK